MVPMSGMSFVVDVTSLSGVYAGIRGWRGS